MSEERIHRIQNLEYQRIIGGHHFAHASTESLLLYRDGYNLGCIMCCQALLEAILKFVAKRNKVNFKQSVDKLIAEIENKNLISEDAINAARRAWRHRNAFHHLNPSVASHDLESKAKECIEAVCDVELEIFGTSCNEGLLIPKNPKYWDIQNDGSVPVFIRNLDLES